MRGLPCGNRFTMNLLKIGAPLENDQNPQDHQIQQQNEVIEQAVDAAQRHRVIGHAGKKEDDGKKWLGERGTKLG